MLQGFRWPASFAMASGVPATSFYASTSRGGEPAPDDDSPQSDGGDATRPHSGDRVPPDDVHGETRDSKSGWATWNSWQDDGWTTGLWSRSWDGGDGWWTRSGWARDSNRYDGHDTKKKGKTWESTSTGSMGSGDGAGHDRESKESFSEQWESRDSCSDAHHSRDDGRDPPDGWGPSTEGRGDPFGGARSCLRQIAAWRRMTRMSKDQQGLTLYQHLTDRAWVDAERLDMNRLGSSEGVDYLIGWAQDTWTSRSLRRGAVSPSFSGSSVANLLSRSVTTWRSLTGPTQGLQKQRMGLEEQAELNLLASIGNEYVLKDLQSRQGHEETMGDHHEEHEEGMAHPETFQR